MKVNKTRSNYHGGYSVEYIAIAKKWGQKGSDGMWKIPGAVQSIYKAGSDEIVGTLDFETDGEQLWLFNEGQEYRSVNAILVSRSAEKGFNKEEMLKRGGASAVTNRTWHQTACLWFMGQSFAALLSTLTAKELLIVQEARARFLKKVQKEIEFEKALAKETCFKMMKGKFKKDPIMLKLRDRMLVLQGTLSPVQRTRMGDDFKSLPAAQFMTKYINP